MVSNNGTGSPTLRDIALTLPETATASYQPTGPQDTSIAKGVMVKPASGDLEPRHCHC